MFVGGTTHLRANVNCSTDVNVNEVTFYVKGMNFLFMVSSTSLFCSMIQRKYWCTAKLQ